MGLCRPIIVNLTHISNLTAKRRAPVAVGGKAGTDFFAPPRVFSVTGELAMRSLSRLSTALLMATVCAAQSSTETQTFWFCPITPATWNNFIGSVDYLDLFAPGAPWAAASSRIQIFKMFTQMIDPSVPGSFSDATLQQIFAYLNSHHIALAVEFGPLTPSAPTGCGMGEGFGGETAIPIATRIQQLGGNLQYLAFDEPFAFGSLFSGPYACHWTPQQVAANALQNVAQIKTVFPNVIVGDIEPVPNVIGSPDWLNQYTAWIDAWRAAAGAPLAFFHFDVNWSINWQPTVESMRQALVQRGIPFGIIYNGWESDLSDAAWIGDSESHYVAWEAQGGAIPDHVIFESWYPYPQHVLPETDPTTFTYLIDSYFRQRTKLSLKIAPSQASGSLLNSQEVPIAAAPIALTAQATTGSGTVSSYLLSGIVPSSVMQAVIQICVNECDEVGTTDINVYSFRYGASDAQTSFNFENGLTGWTVDGNGTAVVQPSSDASGKSIHISATAAQRTFINSAPLTVVPGSSYNLTIQARISPSSVGSGSFALVFLNAAGTEINRGTLEFEPTTSALGATQTASDGTYGLSFTPVDPGGSQLQAAYPGTSTLWPAFASSLLGIAPSIQSNGIVNAADFKSEPLSPETWFTIFGQNLGSAAQWTIPNTFTLGGAGVSVCGKPAEISYNSGPVVTNGVSTWQLNALTPDAVAGQTSCPVVVTVDGQASPSVTVSIASGIMELFSSTSSAGSLPTITHANYSLVGPSSAGLIPAQPGEEVIAWGTGDCSNPIVTVRGKAATVVFSGWVEAGLCQLNFLVPSGSSGEDQLEISTSPSAYLLAVAPE
jgi:uncharacterized protein (TIGR03437 family)